jgi:hypothetical protein
MRKLRVVILPALVMGAVAATAQDGNEAYNLSNLTVQGTARSMGFGNALGSVGGDFSSVSVNPAGLGVYRTSELTFTPSFRINSTNSQFQGNAMNDNNTHYNVNNFGMVFTNAPRGRRYDHRNWKSISFALGMNRVADFNHNYTYQGINQTSSGSEAFESDANLNPNGAVSQRGNTLGAMGYNSYLLNQNASGQFYSIVPEGNLYQVKSVQENGGINEYTLSLGGNYKEKLLLGITVGIPIINYQDNYYFSESLAGGNTGANPYGFSSFIYNQQRQVSGAGINSKIGAIYKITDFFRIGAAIHTPTFYSISDRSNPGLTTTHNDTTQSTGYGFIENRLDYNLTTPWKGVFSATIILKDFGFITADYEYVDYSTMRYELPGGMDYSSGIPFQQEQDSINHAIKSTYKGASDFRLGGEAKISKHFMARLGFGYYGNAYTAYGESMANSFYTTNRIDLSAGIGFHFRHFFADAALVHSMYQGYTEPYTINTNGLLSGQPAVVPQAKIDYSINNVALTVGLKF